MGKSNIRSEINTIVVRMPNWLGDCIMALPALNNLKNSFPLAKIILAARSNLWDFLADQKNIHGLVACPTGGLKGFIKQLSRVNKGVSVFSCDKVVEKYAGFDLGVLFTNSFSTAVWLWQLDVHKRIGYIYYPRKIFLTNSIKINKTLKSMHMADYYNNLISLAANLYTSQKTNINIDYNKVDKLQIGEQSIQAAEAILAKYGVTGDFAVIAPASAYGEVKDWSPSNYAEVVREITTNYGMPVFITGTNKQIDRCASIAFGNTYAHNIAGETGLASFLGLIAKSSLFVGGDSGGTHAAATLGIPTVAIFGATVPRVSRPLGEKVEILGGINNPLAKLSGKMANRKAREILDSITVTEVVTCIDKLLQYSGTANG